MSNRSLILLGIVATLSIGATTYYILQQQKQAESKKSSIKDDDDKKKKGIESDDKTTKTDASSTVDQIHKKIEDLDKKGKVFYKNKQFLEAAHSFSDALELIADDCGAALKRQKITLLNNRSAMYEKGQCFDLALDDCESILAIEIAHAKARPRKLRILESQERWNEALVEVCGIQLQFMQANKYNLRMGIQLPPPPVPPQKVEEILARIVPGELEKYTDKSNNRKTMPGKYTILQLLKSYSNYQDWMGKAVTGGSIAELTDALDAASDVKDKVVVLYKRGRRHVYEREYESATSDYEEALKLVEPDPTLLEACDEVSYADLLEWVGMVRHWHFKLDPALECLREAVKLEPDRAGLLVKQAGIQLDAAKPDEALKLFDQALILNPDCIDALLHRSNLRIMQNQTDQAKSDLERCLRIDPKNLTAQLRLVAVLVTLQDMDGAKRRLESITTDTEEAELYSYRGELLFAQGQLEPALEQFEKAIKVEPSNPTPYVNAALSLLSTQPPPGQMPDTERICKLLEQSIAVDPQISTAYVHLGQVRLGMATNLDTARDVIKLYDEGLKHCRMPEEIKELCGMRILAQAQVDGATMLKMETFNLN